MSPPTSGEILKFQNCIPSVKRFSETGSSWAVARCDGEPIFPFSKTKWHSQSSEGPPKRVRRWSISNCLRKTVFVFMMVLNQNRWYSMKRSFRTELVKKVEFLRKQDDYSWNMQTRLCSRWNFSSFRTESKARKHTEEFFRSQFYEVDNLVILEENIPINNFCDSSDCWILAYVSNILRVSELMKPSSKTISTPLYFFHFNNARFGNMLVTIIFRSCLRDFTFIQRY